MNRQSTTHQVTDIATYRLHPAQWEDSVKIMPYYYFGRKGVQETYGVFTKSAHWADSV